MELGESVTEWLQLWRDGDEDAMSRVTDLVYRDLRRLAAFYLNGESQANTLQPTALVHEAYLRVSQIRKIDWQNRGHFIAIVTNLMRRILVDLSLIHICALACCSGPAAPSSPGDRNRDSRRTRIWWRSPLASETERGPRPRVPHL